MKNIDMINKKLFALRENIEYSYIELTDFINDNNKEMSISELEYMFNTTCDAIHEIYNIANEIEKKEGVVFQ